MFIALTGNIGTGKSFVANILKKDYGFFHISADQINSELLELDNIKNWIAKHISPDVIEKGELNRAKLANIVFNNACLLKKLEDRLHPLIRERADSLIAKYNDSNVVYEIPLLFEKALENDYRPILVVVCHPSVQRYRLLNIRNLSHDIFEKIISMQMPMEKKIEMADYIIDSTFGEISVRKQLRVLLKNWNLI